MNGRRDHSIRSIVPLVSALMAGFAQGAGGALPVAAAATTAAPRAFCEQRGGTVTETGDREVYVCCYREQRKCLVSNTRLNQSVVVDLPWNTQAL